MTSSIFLFIHHTNRSFILSLSQEGLFNLLDSIEGRLRSEQASVYGDSSVDGLELSRIIRYTLSVFLQTF